MKQIYYLTLLSFITFNSLNAQAPSDDGTITSTENFNAVTPPTPASDYFTFDAVLGFGTTSDSFKNTIAFSSTADIDGIAQGIEFVYDSNLFNDEEITLHTFTNVSPGDYIIQYEINAQVAGFSYEAIISDGSVVKQQTVGIQTGEASFQKRYTPQISIGTTSDLSFTMYMSPFFSAFINSTVYIDNVELIKMNDALPTSVAGSTMIQEENFDTASTPPTSSGANAFTNSVMLSSNSDVNGTGQGVEFGYTAAYAEVVNTVDVVTFSNVPAGSYYIEYQFDDGNTNVNRDFTYYNQITDGSTTANNYVVSSTTTGFTTHRTNSITTSGTSNITLKWIGSEDGNNVTYGSPVYLDNVRLMSDPTLSINSLTTQNEKISLFPNPATEFLNINVNGDYKYIMYNVVGGIVKKGNVSLNNNTINVKEIAKNMYILRVFNDNSSQSFKIIVK